MNALVCTADLAGRRKPIRGAYVTPSMALHTGLLRRKYH